MGHNIKRKISVFGGTGLIGRALVRSLNHDNFEISVFSRDINRTTGLITDKISLFPIDHTISKNLENQDIVINLSGENISKRWTKKQKDRILDSRVKSTQRIVSAVNSLKKKPELFIQASAAGYYPFSKSENFNEDSPQGNSFLSRVVLSWEASSAELDTSVRKIILRTGVVITIAGGMLPKLIRPIKLFAGGIPGKGDNWISWIHIDDVVSVLLFLIDSKRSDGIYNLTAPEPVKMKDMIRFCGSVLKRPVILRIPEFLIRIFFGKMGMETILSSQRVVPERLISERYFFKFSDYKKALKKELK